MYDKLKGQNESFVQYAKRILLDDSDSKLGLIEQYKILFEEDVTYDNAQRQLKGVKKFLQKIDENVSDEFDLLGKKTLSMKGDGTQVSEGIFQLSDEQVKDPKSIMEIHGYDPNMYELEKASHSKWNQKSKKDGLCTLYSSKIVVKPKTEISTDDVQRIFDSLDRKYKPKETIEVKNNSKKCLIINFFDVHFGRRSNKTETNEEYNCEEAKFRMDNTINEVISKFKEDSFDTIIFSVGQDFFNSEPSGCTAKGTVQDNDGTYTEIFEKGAELLVSCIDKLYNYFNCKIIVPYVPGNHSTTNEFFLTNFLFAWYRDNDFIEIDKTPTTRKYYKYGKNLFGFTHNNEEGNRLKHLMQIEKPELWADTIEHTWFVGHLHCEDTKETGGLFIRQSPSIAGADRWSNKKGYIGSINRTQMFIYNYDGGIDSIHYSSSYTK